MDTAGKQRNNGLMWTRKERLRPGEWSLGSARVEGNLESPHPAWVMQMFQGNRWIDMAQGPLHTRTAGDRLAATLNAAADQLSLEFILSSLRERLAQEMENLPRLNSLTLDPSTEAKPAKRKRA